jgi:hypothetical protein
MMSKSFQLQSRTKIRVIVFADGIVIVRVSVIASVDPVLRQ